MSLSAHPKIHASSVWLLLAPRVPDPLTFSPFGCCFRSSQVFFFHSFSIRALPHALWRVSTGLYSSLSIYIFSSPGLLSGNSHCLGLLSALSSQFRDSLGFCLCFPPCPCTLTWKFSRQWWGLPHFVLFCFWFFLSSRISLLKIQCLENPFLHIFMVIFKCFRWEGKYDSSYNVLPAIRNLHLERAYTKHFQTSYMTRASTF